MIDCFKLKAVETDAKQIELLRTCKTILRLYGFWPKGGSKNVFFMLRFIFIIICYNTNVVGSIWHLVHVMSKETIDYLEIADDLSIIISVLSVMCVFAAYMGKFDELKELRQEMGNFTVYDKPKDIEKLDAKLNYVSKIFLVWFLASCAYLWTLLFLETCEDGSIDICGFLIAVYLPFDIFTSPYRKMFLTFQCYTCFATVLTAFYVSYSVLGMCSFLRNRVDHLIVLLKTIPTIETRCERKSRIRKCVLYHYKIIELWETFHGLYTIMFFIHVVNTPVTMSLIIYQILQKVKFVPIIHLSGWFVALGMNCIFGQQLIDSSTDLLYSIYESMPFDGDCETQKDLMLITIRCLLPMTVPVGKFGVFDHSSFITVLKTIYSYLTILSSIK